jgi:hypothetical protein
MMAQVNDYFSSLPEVKQRKLIQIGKIISSNSISSFIFLNKLKLDISNLLSIGEKPWS